MKSFAAAFEKLRRSYTARKVSRSLNSTRSVFLIRPIAGSRVPDVVEAFHSQVMHTPPLPTLPTFRMVDSRVHFHETSAQLHTTVEVKDFVGGEEGDDGVSKPQDRLGRKWGWLAGVSRQESDWNRWERHAEGDELVVLLSGAMSLDLELPDGTQSSCELPVGHGVIVPSGSWHRGIVRQAGEVLTVTFGSPSQHRRAD